MLQGSAASSSCASSSNGDSYYPPVVLQGLHDGALRDLASRQGSELVALKEFADLERACVDKEMSELRMQNEHYVMKIQELLQEREALLRSSSSNDSNNSGAEGSNTRGGRDDEMKVSTCSNEGGGDSNLSKLKETRENLSKVSSAFSCLRDLCLRDLAFQNADPKRLMAEATRQLSLTDCTDSMML